MRFAAFSSGQQDGLAVLTAMIGVLFLTNTVAQFSRFIPSAGSFVTFCGKAFGPSVGAAVAVFLIFGYLVAASTVVSIPGVRIAETLKSFAGVSVPRAILTLLIAAGTGWLVMRGVGIALPVYVLRHHRGELDVVRHVLLPIAGTLIMLFPLWGSSSQVKRGLSVFFRGSLPACLPYRLSMAS